MASSKIKFPISAEETAVNNTVRVVATITSVFGSEQSDDDLRASSREVMDRLIPGADWIYSGMTNSQDPSGMERMVLTASARVSETENRKWDARRLAASREGITISNVEIDLSFPVAMVEEVENRLKLEIAKKAKEQCRAFSDAMGINYTIADVDFAFNNAAVNHQFTLSNSRPALMAASASSKTPYGGGFSGDEMGHAAKITMAAMITLRAPVSKS